MTKATNTAFRLTVSFAIFMSLAGLTFASTIGDQVDLAEFASHPEALAGRNIEVNARVIAIAADGKSLELFDSKSRTRIDVRLTQLRKTDRLAMLQSGAQKVTVSGRASVVAGRLTIDALSIQATPLNEEARSGERDNATPTAVVPVVSQFGVR